MGTWLVMGGGRFPSSIPLCIKHLERVRLRASAPEATTARKRRRLRPIMHATTESIAGGLTLLKVYQSRLLTPAALGNNQIIYPNTFPVSPYVSLFPSSCPVRLHFCITMDSLPSLTQTIVRADCPGHTKHIHQGPWAWLGIRLP